MTNREYQAFVQDWRRSSLGDREGDRYPEGKGDYPAVNVSWHDAMAYCGWLSDRTGKFCRLPTEAEWEKAASWDPEAKVKRRYPWGGGFDRSRCNLGMGTTPVGAYYPEGDSCYGVADMAGNVWEWCSTLVRGYPYDPRDGREDLEAEGRRVLRGGSWYFDQWYTRCTYRFGYTPEYRFYLLGFRVVVPSDHP